MSCYHPIKAFRTRDGVVFKELSRYDIIGDIELPCGRCLGCRERRARDWSLRCMHEGQLWPAKCFVTLTYARDKMPPGGSLDHRDFQLFMKRMRKAHKLPIRFFMCGEYGPLNMRPHYHAILYNIDFADRVPAGKSGAGKVFFQSAQLDKFWSWGMCTVQDVNASTVAYCTRYIVDKVVGPDAEMHERYTNIDSDGVITWRKPEYCCASLKPGIGAEWFARFHRDLYPHDFAVLDGQKYGVPKYYDKLLKKSAYDVDGIEYRRELKGKERRADQTDERLLVREVVHKARVSSLKRDSV